MRGVLGPGAANNSKEGGSLIPTVAFGVPGSTAMAILLGGFLLLGLVPGPDMLTKHLAVTYSMVWTIVLANVITVAVCFLFLDRMASVTEVKGHRLIPAILVLVFIGSYTSNSHYGDFVLGLVLGKIAENYLYISVARYEAAWLARPVVLVLIAVAVAVILYPFLQAYRSRSRV